MTKSHQDTNHEQKNRTLEEAMVASLANDQLPCPAVFKIAKEFRIAPKKVGEAADELGLRLVDCQLGCFMYTGVEENISIEHVDQTLQEKLTDSLVNNSLPCPVAFMLAKELKVNRRQVGQTADALGFRISGCQIGCF